MDKLDTFVEITKALNTHSITPLLMGSLGLEFLTKRSWQARDIDIHVRGDRRGWQAPDEERIDNWTVILTIMESFGYKLVDLHEHEFSNGEHSVEFNVIDTLPDFAGIEMDELREVAYKECKFYLPNAAQFLKIYQHSYLDSYRAENNNHKDLAKIAYLEKLCEEEMSE